MNPKKKGNKGENKWAAWIRDHLDPFSYRNSGSGSGVAKSDTHNTLGINFEVKTVKALNLLKAYKQSEGDALKSQTIPYVVVHFDGMAQDEWLVCMSNHDWLELYKKAREPKMNVNPDREFKWLLQKLKDVSQQVIRRLDK